MPRLPRALLRKAYNISPFLPLVLRGARTLESAINELRWLREHAQEASRGSSAVQGLSTRSSTRTLLQLCRRRARSEPLQYILGSQPFGELDIKCYPGVLIPRPETEAYTTHLASLLYDGPWDRKPSSNLNSNSLNSPKQPALRIVDLCSGTGCISLLLYSLLSKQFPQLYITGWDVSNAAISLARENLRTNIKSGRLPTPIGGHVTQVCFDQVDIFSNLTDQQKKNLNCDILISNPPYISRESFAHETSRSVRNWEPKLALVPEVASTASIPPEDMFYDRIIGLRTQSAKSRVLLMEVGDDSQAMRVAKMALGHMIPDYSDTIEIWRDWPDQLPGAGEKQHVVIGGQIIPLKGSGNMRAVVLWSQAQAFK